MKTTKPRYLLMQEIEKNNMRAKHGRQLPNITHVLVAGVFSVLTASMLAFLLISTIKASPAFIEPVRQLTESTSNDFVAELAPSVDQIVVVGQQDREVKQFVTMLRHQGYTVLAKSTHHRETAYSVRGRENRTFTSQIELVTYLKSVSKMQESSK